MGLDTIGFMQRETIFSMFGLKMKRKVFYLGLGSHH